MYIYGRCIYKVVIHVVITMAADATRTRMDLQWDLSTVRISLFLGREKERIGFGVLKLVRMPGLPRDNT